MVVAGHATRVLQERRGPATAIASVLVLQAAAAIHFNVGDAASASLLRQRQQQLQQDLE